MIWQLVTKGNYKRTVRQARSAPIIMRSDAQGSFDRFLATAGDTHLGGFDSDSIVSPRAFDSSPLRILPRPLSSNPSTKSFKIPSLKKMFTRLFSLLIFYSYSPRRQVGVPSLLNSDDVLYLILGSFAPRLRVLCNLFLSGVVQLTQLRPSSSTTPDAGPF